MNRWICRLGCGFNWAEECTSSIVFARWRQCCLGMGRPLKSLATFCRKVPKKGLNRSICRLGCGLNSDEACTTPIVFAVWRLFARWLIYWRLSRDSWQLDKPLVISKCSAVAEMGDRLAKIEMSRKWGLCFWGQLDPRLTQCGLGPGLPLYQVACWSIQSYAL